MGSLTRGSAGAPSRHVSTALAVVLLLLASASFSTPVAADASNLQVDASAVQSGTALSGTVVDGPANDGKNVVVSLDSNGDGVYNKGEPQVTVASNDANTSLVWSGLSTTGLAEGTYTIYAVEAKDVKDKSPLTGTTTTVEVDDTAPTITNYSVTNPTGRQVQISFTSTERLSTIAVTILGPESATVDEGSFSESGAGPYTYTGTYTAGLDGNYTAALSTAADAARNDGAAGESGTVAVLLDSTPPDLQTAVTGDANRDGTVDRIFVTYSEPVDDATVAASNFTVAGGTVTAVSTGATADDNRSVLTATGLPANDTSLTPTVTLAAGGVSDLAGNGGPASATTVTATDGPAPVIVAVTTADEDANGQIDRVNVTFSEGVTAASTDVADYDVGGTTYSGESIVAGTDDGDASLTVEFSEGSSPDTGATPDLTYTRGTTADAAGNRLANTTFAGTTDGARPALALTTANPTADGFDVEFRPSEPGDVHFVVVEAGATAPSTAQVVAGLNATGHVALVPGTVDVEIGNTTVTDTVAGLASDTDYEVYAVAEDGAGNRQANPSSTGVSTAEAAPGGGGSSGDGSNTGTGGGSTGGGGGGGGVSSGTSITTSRYTGGIRLAISNPQAGQVLGTVLLGSDRKPVAYRQIAFEFVAQTEDFSVTIEPGHREPFDPEFTGATVLDYAIIHAWGLRSGAVSQVRYRVRVDQGALPDTASLDDVRFYRYDGGAWHQLPASREGNDFTVTTRELSTFAVVVDQPATSTPTEVPTATPTQTPTSTPTPATTARPPSTTPPVTTRSPGMPGFDLLGGFLGMLGALLSTLRRLRRP